ncbi:MAG: class I SAM-dependent methyltransferase [Actinobacteria bacterium]|nr:class I SAM-dependent methyltransferase [Actinomycetota bacterium]
MTIKNLDKVEAQKQWTATPCGSSYVTYERGTLEFFDELRRAKAEIDTWVQRYIPFKFGEGKKVLDVGCGMGNDLLSFSLAGAECHAIDLTEEHVRLARLNFELHNREAGIKQCDAAQICYPDNYFDIVYSLGVLHHTPDIEDCLAEIYRVLKPGGLFIMALYYKYSAFHVFSKVLTDGILRGKLFKLGYSGLMATVEAGADGINIKPLVKTYSKRKLNKLLKKFEDVEFKVAHFNRYHMGGFRPFIKNKWEKRLEHYLGWYVISYAKKPKS